MGDRENAPALGLGSLFLINMKEIKPSFVDFCKFCAFKIFGNSDFWDFVILGISDYSNLELRELWPNMARGYLGEWATEKTR